MQERLITTCCSAVQQLWEHVLRLQLPLHTPRKPPTKPSREHCTSPPFSSSAVAVMALKSLHHHQLQHRCCTTPSIPWRCSKSPQHARRLIIRTAQHAKTGTGQAADKVTTTSSNSNGNGTTAADKHGLTEQQAVEAPKRQFDWFKSWYPVAILEDLDPALPMHTQLLGMDLAIWWDSNAKQWRCARLE